MTWHVLDQYPPDNPYTARCSKCLLYELDRPSQAEPDKVVLTSISIPVEINGVEVLHEAQVAFCTSCLTEGGVDIGMIPGPKAEELRRSNRDLGAKAKKANEKLTAYEELGVRLREIEA